MISKMIKTPAGVFRRQIFPTASPLMHPKISFKDSPLLQIKEESP